MDRDRILILRTCGPRGESYGGFVWPLTVGAQVEAPDWDPRPICPGGLHGLPWGEGAGSLLSLRGDRRWLVVSAEKTDVVEFCGKCKARRVIVEHVGDRKSATAYLVSRAPGRAVCYATVTAGDYGHATVGYGGHATVGYGGHATAGHCGTATAGECGHATAGHCGHATAGHCGHATAGHCGHATVGDCGTAKAGKIGTVSIRWYDGSRMRLAVGHVGEDGIKPGVAYRVHDGALCRDKEAGVRESRG